MGELILQGSANFANQSEVTAHEFDEDFGFEIMRSTPLQLRQKIKKMLREM